MKKIFTILLFGTLLSGLMAQKKVTFKVDMNSYTGGSFTTVYVSGTFNSWSGNSNALADADADGVWEGTFDINDDSIEYKFTMDNWNKQESLAPGSTCTKTTSGYTNRFQKLTGNVTLDKVCFESCSACTGVKKSVTFNVNMKQYSGSYTNVYVSGTFNSWSGNSNQLTDADGDKIFSGTFDITQDSIEYKFLVDNWKDDEKLASGSACTKTSGGYTNRFTKISGTKTLPNVCWGSCSECTNDVTFKVDMAKYKGAAFTTVYVNGSFNGWCGSCNAMDDSDKNGIWEVKLPIAQDSIEFLYTLDGWTAKEIMKEGSSCTKTTAGYTNRFLKITGNTVLDVTCFESCVNCANTKEKANVTFRVDMSKNTATYNAVNLNGSFNGWCGACTPLTDANNDKVYEVTLSLNATDTFEYLFTLDGWSAQEKFTGGEGCTKTTGQYTNRMVSVKGDSTLPAVCWESCVSCANTVKKANVTFKVDLSKYAFSYKAVNLIGSFDGWCASCNPMTDADSNKIYEITLPMTNPDTIEYLFAVDGWNESFKGGESCTKTTGQYINRISIINGDVSMPAVCWEKCETCGTLGNANIAAGNVRVFPNPGNGIFKVSALFSKLTSGNLEVYDVVGHKLYSKGFSGNAIDTEINLNSAKAGMYLMVINTTEGSYQERIFINSK
jgi:1,4-alpha-glucan branching enzyme